MDYTIIGGGIVGLSTAIELKQTKPSVKVLVLDKKDVPFGASTKNAGFACFGSISEIHDDYSSFGEDVARKLIQMRWEGLSIMKSRVGKLKMEYKSAPGAEVFASKEDRDYYTQKLPWANEFVADIVEASDCYSHVEGRFGSELVNRFEGSLNPQKMMADLELQARTLGVVILSGVEVINIDTVEHMLSTRVGELPFQKLIVCTNGFSQSLLPDEDIKPARNQVLITEEMPGFELDKCYHMNKGYVYFRSYQNRLLIGGGRHLDIEGETTDKLVTTDVIMDYLRDIVQTQVLRGETFKIAHVWSGILGVGNSKMPIVKYIDEDVLVAIRMGGMGVAIGSFIGQVAASAILQSENRSYRLYVR